MPPPNPIEGAKRGLDIPQDSRKPPPTWQGLSCWTGGTPPPASLARPQRRGVCNFSAVLDSRVTHQAKCSGGGLPGLFVKLIKADIFSFLNGQSSSRALSCPQIALLFGGFPFRPLRPARRSGAFQLNKADDFQLALLEPLKVVRKALTGCQQHRVICIAKRCNLARQRCGCIQLFRAAGIVKR